MKHLLQTPTAVRTRFFWYEKPTEPTLSEAMGELHIREDLDGVSEDVETTDTEVLAFIEQNLLTNLNEEMWGKVQNEGLFGVLKDVFPDLQPYQMNGMMVKIEKKILKRMDEDPDPDSHIQAVLDTMDNSRSFGITKFSKLTNLDEQRFIEAVPPHRQKIMMKGGFIASKYGEQAIIEGENKDVISAELDAYLAELNLPNPQSWTQDEIPVIINALLVLNANSAPVGKLFKEKFNAVIAQIDTPVLTNAAAAQFMYEQFEFPSKSGKEYMKETFFRVVSKDVYNVFLQDEKGRIKRQLKMYGTKEDQARLME